MKILIQIFSGLLFAFISGALLALVRFLAVRSMQIAEESKRKFQDDVFGWAYKIVCTIEEEYRNSDLEKKAKSRKKFDQAVSRFNDVLMINGTDPKLWNYNGIVTYSVHILHNNK